LFNAVPGTWTWAGANATTTQLMLASPGTYTWAGASVSTNQAVDATPGAWNWAGSASTIFQQANVDATPGAWTWIGVPAGIEKPASLEDQIAELQRQLAIAKKLARGGWKKRHEPHRHDPTKNNQIIMALVGAVVHGFKTDKEPEK
jgi:hypothetical protein